MFLLMPLVAFMSSGVSSKSNTWKEGTITLPLPQGTSLSLGTGGVSSWMETRRGGREAVSVLSFQENKPGNLCWILTSASHTFSFSVHFTNIIVHQSFIFLSESLVTENKLKIFFQTHCLWTPLTQYEIRWIIFFAAKDGEALYSQQKQDQELTATQIMNSYCQIQT